VAELEKGLDGALTNLEKLKAFDAAVRRLARAPRARDELPLTRERAVQIRGTRASSEELVAVLSQRAEAVRGLFDQLDLLEGFVDRVEASVKDMEAALATAEEIASPNAVKQLFTGLLDRATKRKREPPQWRAPSELVFSTDEFFVATPPQAGGDAPSAQPVSAAKPVQ
jgi:hypothetical protein